MRGKTESVTHCYEVRKFLSRRHGRRQGIQAKGNDITLPRVHFNADVHWKPDVPQQGGFSFPNIHAAVVSDAKSIQTCFARGFHCFPQTHDAARGIQIFVGMQVYEHDATPWRSQDSKNIQEGLRRTAGIVQLDGIAFLAVARQAEQVPTQGISYKFRFGRMILNSFLFLCSISSTSPYSDTPQAPEVRFTPLSHLFFTAKLLTVGCAPVTKQASDKKKQIENKLFLNYLLFNFCAVEDS
jgi:hypothetical protein